MKIVGLLIFLVVFMFDVHATQDTIWNQHDEQGEKTGWWRGYNNQGDLQYQGFFQHSEPLGKFVRYFDDGETVRIIQLFDDESQEVKTQIFYGDGSLASEGVYVNRKKEGIWVSYSYYNKNKLLEEHFKSGALQGERRKFFENGKLQEVVDYEAGVKQGRWLQFFPGGSKKLEASYENGSAHGDYVSYYPSGRLHMKGIYNRGLKEGVWLVYDQDGGLVSDMEYRNGIPVDLEKLEQQEQEFFRKQEEKARTLREPADML